MWAKCHGESSAAAVNQIGVDWIKPLFPQTNRKKLLSLRMDRIHNGFQRRVWERNELDSGEDLAGKWRSCEDHAGLFTTATGPDRHGWLDGINFWLETSRRPAAMDGTRASSITGCGSGEHGFVMRSQTRWAGSWRQKRIHGRSLPTGRRRRNKPHTR